MKYVCGTCRYHKDEMCHYNPPTTVFVDYTWMAVYPPCTDKNPCCSKWEKKKKDAERT